jgi:ABC-2 type transport system permease protein
MGKIGLIISREYTTRVRKKSFVIMTFLGPILFTGLMVAAIWVGTTDTNRHQVLVVDYAGFLTAYDSTLNKHYCRIPGQFRGSDLIGYDFRNDRPDDEDFINGPYTLMIEFDEGISESKKGHLIYKKVPSVGVVQAVTRELENSIEMLKVTEELSLDYATYKRLKTPISLVQIDIRNQDEASTKQEQATVGMIFSVIIFFFIFLYSAQVMRGVIEEKTNRIVEIIVSSVRPFQLMMGKIIGIGLVGLTQFFMWIGLSLLIMLIGQMVFETGMMSPSGLAGVNGAMSDPVMQPDFYETLAQNEVFNVFLRINWPLMIVLFLFYFIGGYLLYGSLFAAIGAAVDNETDTQQFMTPVMLPLFFSYFVAIMSVQNPEGTAATIFSLVPFTAPPVMMVRIATGIQGTDLWQLLLSMTLLIGTIFLTVWFAGKIYRVGILMYGKKPSYKELWKWMFYRA